MFAGNITANGTNTLNSALAYTRKNNTALASGNNNAGVDCSTNVYLKVSGPSAAFAINGVNGGYNGRILVIQNSTGQTMTIANDSGVDPTAANRIYTGLSQDLTITNSPGVVVTLMYDSAATHWTVIGVNIASGSATANYWSLSGSDIEK